MTSDAQGPALTSAQVLDELELMAAVEHALVVEWLSVACALGHGLEVGEGGATSPQGQEAAGVAYSMAQGEMFHLAAISRALVDAGRSVQLGRASTLSSATGVDVPLDPPTTEQLRSLLSREEAIGNAVVWHYARLAPTVTTAPVFEGDLLDSLRTVIVDNGSSHDRGHTALREALGDPPPPDYLRVPRREASDSFEQRLLDVSDSFYGLVVSALQQRFGEDPFVGGSFRSLAVSAMEGLDASNLVLGQRGLLPPFTR